MSTWFPSVVAILALVLTPLMPQLLRIRLRFLKWLNWDWAVHLLEDHFQGWVLFGRIALFAVAMVAALVAVRAGAG